MKAQDYQCLMIKTKDSREFFTHEKNYIQLIEFSKVFKAEISLVKVKQAEILDLEELAPAFCSQNYNKIKSEYQILEVKISQKTKNRQEILKDSEKIKKYIEKELKSGNIVTLKNLTKKFNKVTTACLCNHLSFVRKKIEQEGHQIQKLGGGKYKIKQPD